MCYLYCKSLCIQLGKVSWNGKKHLVFFIGPIFPFDRVSLISCYESLHSWAVTANIHTQAVQVIPHLHHIKLARVNTKHISNELEHKYIPCTEECLAYLPSSTSFSSSMTGRVPVSKWKSEEAVNDSGIGSKSFLRCSALHKNWVTSSPRKTSNRNRWAETRCWVSLTDIIKSQKSNLDIRSFLSASWFTASAFSKSINLFPIVSCSVKWT